jgi:two-component system CheB/CheR fusion protein
MRRADTYDDLVRDNEELRLQLEEANDNIQAIRMGQVDAFVVQGEDGHQLYTLKTADQTYRLFIEKMNEGAVTLNGDGLILYSNSRFAAMLNLPLEKVLGVPFQDFISEQVKNRYHGLISNGWEEDCKEEICMVTSYGSEIPCLLSCTRLEWDGEIALSLIITDLTIQKHVETQLQHKNEQLEEAHSITRKLNEDLEDIVKERTNELLLSREHFKLLANNIPQMIWTSLPNGDTNFYNQQWYNYTLLEDFAAREDVWRHIIHPDDLENTTRKYNSSLATGTVFEIENRYKNGRDGTYRWYLNRAIPLKNDEGEIILWVGTATDIQEQKQQMQRKDEFIGIASHELKTPLTSLKGYLQLMASFKKDKLPPVIVNYIIKANTAINKLQHLISDLLDVSKIQAGRLEYSLEKIDLAGFMDSWIENAEHINPTHTFHNEAKEHFTVLGNAERLEQVVMNFISNAVKYSPDSKEIIIKTIQLGDLVRISVTDFGIGLTDEQIKRIFERFYRVEDKKYMTSGLGMGLYISSEIISAHNGAIGVESVPGKGSTFYFELALVG